MVLRKKKSLLGSVERAIGRRVSTFKRRRREEAAFQRIVDKQATAAGRRERLKQEIKLAKESARINARQRLKSFRSKTQTQSRGGGAIAGFRQFATDFSANVAKQGEGVAGTKRKRRKRKGGDIGLGFSNPFG